VHGEFLLGAGALLGALALSGLLFQRLRQSVIPAFILLGLVVNPLVSDLRLVRVLATIGVVLLLFYMGLEFSLAALLRARRRILRNGALDLLICFPPGLVAGLLLGWGLRGGLLLAGAFYVSSSAIISKSIIELRRAANPETETVLGVLVFEDLFLALFLAVLSGAVLVSEPAPLDVAAGVGRAALFLGVVLLVTLRAQPLLARLFDLTSDDLLVLLVSGVVLLLAWVATAAGLSEAIGAFLAGLMLAETPQKERVERLFAPLQGVFAAVFFLAFGISIDLGAFGRMWPYALSLTLLGIALKLAAGWIIGRRDGLDQRGSLALGLALIARGEFSIVLAGVALSAGLSELSALVALLVLALSLAGTVAMQFSPAIVMRVFPRRRGRVEFE
jgi:CPA2 family monovalent cation:H+ antiporter-2